VLAFDSSLSDALETHSTESFWVLKLYYNAEGSSDFIGVSDQDRIDGSDTYYGIVSSWGGLSHSLDFFNFTTSLMNMSVKLINTDNTIAGGRFSDLFSTYNFANRKWELFQNTGRAGTYDTSTRMIGTGVISGDFSYGSKSIALKLLDFTSKYNKQLPTATITSTTYPNAPEKNIGKPIPMTFGDFSVDSNAPTSTVEFDRHFTKGKFPAVISDEWNATNSRVEAIVDNVALHTLAVKNIYSYKDAFYFPADDTNTTESETAPAKITVKGSTWYTYLPLKKHNTYDTGNYANEIDGDFTTAGSTMNAPFENANVRGYRIPKIPKLGSYSSINLMIDFKSQSGTPEPGLYVSNNSGGNDIAVTWNGADQLVNIATLYGSTAREDWDFEGDLFLDLDNGDAGSGTASFDLYQVGIEIGFIPDTDKVFTQTIQEQYEETVTGGFAVKTQFEDENESFTDTIIRTRTSTVNTPALVDYMYCAGKGRKYHASIVSRNDYAVSDFYENPVFIIEEIMRTALGLSTEIDTASFDTSGNYDSGTPSNDGDLKDIFNEDKISDVKFAFSQNKFINSKDLINRLCKQILSWVFVSGDGKYKIKTLKRTYSSANKTIDFNDCNLKSISRTSLGGVRNDITINYKKDYGQDQFLSSVNPTADATSVATGVNGYNQNLKMKMDADIIDSTTATKLAEAYRDIFKDRKIIIDFDCGRPKYNDLEIGDIILFSNWDSGIKIYGASMGTDYYIVSSINKNPNGSSIKAIKVS